MFLFDLLTVARNLSLVRPAPFLISICLQFVLAIIFLNLAGEVMWVRNPEASSEEFSALKRPSSEEFSALWRFEATGGRVPER